MERLFSFSTLMQGKGSREKMGATSIFNECGGAMFGLWLAIKLGMRIFFFFFLITLLVSTNGGMGWDLVSVWWIERGIGKD